MSNGTIVSQIKKYTVPKWMTKTVKLHKFSEDDFTVKSRDNTTNVNVINMKTEIITESSNAGFPMAALAGALGTKLEKINYYAVGDGNIELTKSHIISAIRLMKVSSILFCGLVTVPIISVLSFLGLWLHA